MDRCDVLRLARTINRTRVTRDYLERLLANDKHSAWASEELRRGLQTTCQWIGEQMLRMPVRFLGEFIRAVKRPSHTDNEVNFINAVARCHSEGNNLPTYAEVHRKMIEMYGRNRVVSVHELWRINKKLRLSVGRTRGRPKKKAR
jgi:hypothetical protein